MDNNIMEELLKLCGQEVVVKGAGNCDTLYVDFTIVGRLSYNGSGIFYVNALVGTQITFPGDLVLTIRKEAHYFSDGKTITLDYAKYYKKGV